MTHTHTELVGLLCTSDQPDAETSTSQHTTLTIDIHASGGIPNHNCSKRTAADPGLRPRDHLDRRKDFCVLQNVHSGYWAHPASYAIRRQVLPWCYGGQGVKLTTLFHLVPRLRMNGVTPLYQLYASVAREGRFYLLK